MNSQSNSKLLIPAAILVAGLIIAGAVVYTKKTPLPLEEKLTETEETGKTAGTGEAGGEAIKFDIKESDHVRGDFSAPITIVEYSDFQCPFCSKFHPTVKQILEDYPGKVRWVYKHFPLDQIHLQARPAAEAAECVFEQKGNDGFWQFSDSLFENQEELGEVLYKELAGQLSLNLEQFNDCLTSRKYKNKVEEDYQEGVVKGVQGTPGNFVNGLPLAGAVPYATLKAVVDQVLSDF